MTSVSCSDGSNGLIPKYGWQTQGAVAGFPNIGGYVGIAGWNSPQVRISSDLSPAFITNIYQCGTCYGVTYNGKTIYVLAIDHTANGFNLAKGAMDKLTNGQSEAVGRIDAQYAQVPVSNCGL
jgi:hypothetical protein